MLTYSVSPPRTVAPPALAVDGLTVHRGGRPVLREISFAAAAGSVIGLLGPSGCGKTTLMRAVVGVQRIGAGTVSVLGAPAGAPELRSRIGYMTQAASVYEDLTVADNLRYFARIAGVPSERIGTVTALVALEDHADRLVGRLSGGQRARVSLAVALLGEPGLLILDEPTVGLDPVLRRDLWETFSGLAAAGTTLLVSSHVMDEAARCDHLLLMRDGAIIAQDSPEALLAATGAGSLEDAFLALVGGADTEGARR